MPHVHDVDRAYTPRSDLTTMRFECLELNEYGIAVREMIIRAVVSTISGVGISTTYAENMLGKRFSRALDGAMREFEIVDVIDRSVLVVRDITDFDEQE